MERRFVVFMALTLLIWSTFIALRVFFAPPPAVPPAGEEIAAQADQPQANKDQAAEKSGDARVPPAENEKGGEPAIGAKPGPVEPVQPLARYALGSLDPASPYRLLATIVNRGAAVERVELNSPRYRSVEDHGGYLGSTLR